jgi:uncharacterized protein YndB with AHSA1/START domain
MKGDTIDIDAPPERVWPHVVDLALMREWHPKLVSAEPVTSGHPRVGSTWKTASRLGKRQRRFLSRIEVCEPFTRVVFVHQDDARRDRFARETIELAPHNGGTRIVQSLDLTQSGIALPWRLIIGFIARFGSPAGPSIFAELKRRLEQR